MEMSLELPTEQRFVATEAIVIYRTGERPGASLATHHPIITKRDGTALGVGRFVTLALIDELLEATRSARPITYVPANVVGISDDHVAWYEPASVRPLYFTGADPATQAFDGVPLAQPPLLFVAGQRQFRVYALAEDVRPDLQTQLHCAPYYNVFDDHRVCVGTMAIPGTIAPETTQQWTTAFFSSNFTHLSSGKRWTFDGTYAEMLEAVNAAGRFDRAWLRATTTTVGQALCGA